LNLSIEFEKDTGIFYELLLSFVEDRESKDLLEKIIDEEHNHASFKRVCGNSTNGLTIRKNSAKDTFFIKIISFKIVRMIFLQHGYPANDRDKLFSNKRKNRFFLVLVVAIWPHGVCCRVPFAMM
jgi:hypothetical protein